MKITNKKYYIFILLIFLCSQVLATGKSKADDLTDCMNYVLIQGSSNINKFELINYYPSVFKSSNAENHINQSQHIKIPVNKFSGSSSMMLNDFHKILKASKYPFINIEIESRETADFDETTGLTNFNAKISIAGNTNNYNIPCQIIFCEKSGLIVKGNLELELSDFNIDPPKKMFGAVKVDDGIIITFAFLYH